MKTISEIGDKVSGAFDLPGEILSGEAGVTVTAGKRALVENHKGILSLDDSRLVVGTKRGRLIFCGSGLYLAAMDADSLLICGKIQTVEWE